MRLALATRAAPRDPRPGWVLAGAELDLDFEAGRYWAGRALTRAQDLPGWTSGPALISGGGLVCDGNTAWRADLPAWTGDSLEGLTVRADVTETPGAQGVGYLFILHAATLSERVATLTTRSVLASRVTRAGVETFTNSAAINPGARYQGVIAVRPGDGRLAASGGASAGAATADPPGVHRFEIGGFNSSLPLQGVVHRLTLWRGRLDNARMDGVV